MATGGLGGVEWRVEACATLGNVRLAMCGAVAWVLRVPLLLLTVSLVGWSWSWWL